MNRYTIYCTPKQTKKALESDAINYPTRQEATLAAIDAALDCLIKNKK